MAEAEKGHGRTYRLHYPGNLVDQFQALPPDQPFGESGAGWPYRKIAQDYSPAADRTTVTLIPYPVDEYGSWLERQQRAYMERLAQQRREADR